MYSQVTAHLINSASPTAPNRYSAGWRKYHNAEQVQNEISILPTKKKLPMVLQIGRSDTNCKSFYIVQAPPPRPLARASLNLLVSTTSRTSIASSLIRINAPQLALALCRQKMRLRLRVKLARPRVLPLTRRSLAVTMNPRRPSLHAHKNEVATEEGMFFFYSYGGPIIWIWTLGRRTIISTCS